MAAWSVGWADGNAKDDGYEGVDGRALLAQVLDDERIATLLQGVVTPLQGGRDQPGVHEELGTALDTADITCRTTVDRFSGRSFPHTKPVFRKLAFISMQKKQVLEDIDQPGVDEEPAGVTSTLTPQP